MVAGAGIPFTFRRGCSTIERVDDVSPETLPRSPDQACSALCGCVLLVAAVEGSGIPSRDALQAISPNPGRAGLHIVYALREAGSVTFDVVDLAGRIVPRIEPGERAAETWTDSWPATDAGGQRLRPGIYVVRMRAGDRVIGSRKLTLLE